MLTAWTIAALKCRRATFSSNAHIGTISLIASYWSFASFVPLFIFYLHYCAISSRYVVDFAPSIGASVVGLIMAFDQDRESSKRAQHAAATIIACVISVWLVCEIAISKTIFPKTTALSQAEVLEALNRPKLAARPIPDFYSYDMDTAEVTNILQNGRGWDHSSGVTAPVVTLFVENPEKLILDVEAVEPLPSEGTNVRNVQVRIGLEPLSLERVEDRGALQRLIFSAPRRQSNRTGIQVVFVKFVPVADFRATKSPFRLISVRWR